MKELLKKKNTKAALLLIVVAVIAIIMGMNVQSAQKEKEYNAHIEAAEKYLTELDYEQAIAEYTLALEIEPNAEEVLNGLEKTYLAYADALADAGEYEKAIQILNEGYAQTGRDSLQEKLAQIQEMQAQAEEEANRQVGMQKIFDLMEEGDYEGALQVAYNYEIADYVSDLPEKVYLYFPGGNTDMSGMGVGVYAGPDGRYVAVYYGNYNGGMREGKGIYYYLSYFFTGEWSNDAPNGYGEEIYMPENVGLVEGETVEGNVRSITKGNLVNGLWDGLVQVEVPLWMGTTWDLSFTAQNGVPEDRTEDFILVQQEQHPERVEINSNIAEIERSYPHYTYLFIRNIADSGHGFDAYYFVRFVVIKGGTIGIGDFADAQVQPEFGWCSW